MSTPILHIVGGIPTCDEVAALLVALLAAGSAEPAPPLAVRRPQWTPSTFLVPHSWHVHRPTPVP